MVRVFVGVALLSGVARAQATAPPSSALSERSLGNLFEAPAGKSHRCSSTSNDPQSNLDFVPLASGAEVPIAELKGPGVITHLWLNVQSDDPYAGRLVVLRARWDGEPNPSIEVPIGDFFGVGFALDGNVDTLPVRVTADGRARSCWWPMPFASSAQLSIRNDSQRPVRMLQWTVDWNEAACPKEVRTFHAQFRATGRGASARAHKVLDVKGRGHYVGTVLSIWSGEEGWPGEGDDRFHVDGADLPTLQGSGLEDYFGDSWGFHLGTGPFGGVTTFEGTGPGARSTAVRWHVQDPIAFEKSLVVNFERSGWVRRADEWKLAPDRPDAFSSVAFWYQEEPHGALTILPPPSERLPFSEIRYEPEEKAVFKSLSVPEGAPPPIRQEGAFWSYGAQVQFTAPDREHARLFMPFDVPSVHDYDFYLRCTMASDGGVWQAVVDGEPFGPPIDLYSPYGTSREIVLGRLHMAPGAHVLELRAIGKNVASGGFALGFDSFMVRWYS
jgi:hypothetical protein